MAGVFLNSWVDNEGQQTKEKVEGFFIAIPIAFLICSTIMRRIA